MGPEPPGDPAVLREVDDEVPEGVQGSWKNKESHKKKVDRGAERKDAGE